MLQLKNLFKKEAKQVLVIGAGNTSSLAVALASHSHYSPEILAIHNEFEIASDKLLASANRILEQAKGLNESKANRLESLGFKNTKDVVEIKPILINAKLSKETIELISYYKKNYPFNKFITEDQVKEICHKYNLVCGDVDRFKGFVPEKNLKEIEKFKLKEKDYTEYYKYGTRWDTIENHKKRFGNNDSYFDTHRVGNDINKYYKDKSKLKICAPVKDMDISGLELEDGYKLVKKEIPDPVVLQPVNGGYLVLTKWGPEASDPILLNEINN